MPRRSLALVVAAVVATAIISSHLYGADMSVIELSRSSCVRVESRAGKSKGTGFLVSERHVLTCFHVVAKITQQGSNTTWAVFPDLKVVLDDGQEIDAVCVSLPNQKELDPLQYDFAFLELKEKPNKPHKIVPLPFTISLPAVGSDILFSGDPLQTPAMVTHQGFVSGIDPAGQIICLQAPVNKGNSGGAVINSSGFAVAIVNAREGGISVGLDELREQIAVTSQQGSVQLMGVDPLQSIRAIINTLDTYISTGIGYGVGIRYACNYTKKHPELLK
jgi:S1-C subfamily serine protease